MKSLTIGGAGSSAAEGRLRASDNAISRAGWAPAPGSRAAIRPDRAHAPTTSESRPTTSAAVAPVLRRRRGPDDDRSVTMMRGYPGYGTIAPRRARPRQAGGLD